MINIKTSEHFNSISSTWETKGWVNSVQFNRKISNFIECSEKRIGLNKKKFKSSLYFGIGTGALFRYLSSYNLAGVDVASGMLQQCHEGIIQILSKVEDLPFLMNNQFNLTFSRNLLKHCESPREAVGSMYQKTREGHIAITVESVVLDKRDRDIPTNLVRMGDPSHPRFLTAGEVIDLFYQAGFSRVEHEIVTYRSAWLKRWVTAEQLDNNAREEIIKMYQQAPKSFKHRQNVRIHNGEITSDVPWVMIRAIK